jgi:hypothetical protein
MLRDTIFALGLLLSTASQLRAGSSPIGAGELFLVVWSIMVLARQLIGGDQALRPALSVLLKFWGIFVCAEAIGYMTGLLLGVETDPEWFFHDLMAYPLVALVSCLLTLETASRIRRIAWLLSLSGALALAVQSAAAVDLISIPGVEPWYWERMRGWSMNPNQLAFLCATLSLIALHLADKAAGRSERVCAVTFGILPVVVGRMTGSDTFTLMLLASGLLFTVLKSTVWLRTSGATTAPRVAFALVLVIGLPVLASSSLPALLSLSGDTNGVAKGLMKNGGKDADQEADLRFALWGQAIKRGLSTGLLGLGPGPHLAIPLELVKARTSEDNAPDNIQHPEINGIPNFEAHNTVLDLFVQGGILADLSFIWLLYRAFRSSYRGGLAGLATLLCCLTLFGMTNLIIRQPLFWFAIVSCLIAGPTASRAPVGIPLPSGPNNRILV